MEQKPELIMLYEMYDYPVGARCSACGKTMPQSKKWINPLAENLRWLRAQFELHLAQNHSPDEMQPQASTASSHEIVIFDRALEFEQEAPSTKRTIL